MIRAGGNTIGANDKIQVALIGCKGMGFEDLKAFLRNPKVECIALSDIDESVLNERAADTEKITGKKSKASIQRLASCDRQQRCGCGNRRNTGPLALPADGGSLPGKKRCLLRKTVREQHRRV